MTIIDALIPEHRQLEKLFKTLEATPQDNPEAREHLFGELSALLRFHTEGEEFVLYNEMKNKPEVRDKTLEAIEEHHVGNLLLDELANLPKDNEAWISKLTVLRESITHHLAEEEKDLFITIKDIYSQAELEKMGDQYRLLKEERTPGLRKVS